MIISDFLKHSKIEMNRLPSEKVTQTNQDYESDGDSDDCSEDDEAEVEEIVLDSSIREVHVPQLKWRAKSYHTMIDWKKELVSEPPFIAKLTDDEIVNILDTPLVVPKWSNNTQSVERGIKLVSEACTAVTGKVERDGYIRQRIHSRKLMPQFNTKRDFNHNL